MNKKVVVFGGGTGLSYLLKGLKDFPLDITAVITVSDSGKSTGKLREEFHAPAVGDIRKVLSSLSSTSPSIKDMLEYRFNTTSDLDGHALGNLILISLLNITGSLKESINELCSLLDIKNKVLPLTEDASVTLMAEMVDGSIVEGEELVTKSEKKVKKAIMEADLILFSMGSLYTSLFPHLLAPDVIECLDKVNAPIMYLCNIVTQPGETDNFTVSDHVKLINSYLSKHKLDAVIASNSKISEEMALRYANEQRKDPVLIDYPVLSKLDIEFIEADLLTVSDGTLKHHSQKLSALIFSYLMR